VNVLLVEDSATDAKLIVRELRRHGLEPQWLRVEDAGALEQALLDRRWHVVISDSSLPGLTVIEALGLTKRLQPGVPFVAVSGSLTAERAVEALRSGATAYVTKDRLDRIGQVVVRELARARLPEGPASTDVSRRLLAAQEEERRRIARALHDEFGQLLATLRMTVAQAADATGPARDRAITEAVALVDAAIQQVRDFYVVLWPVVLDDLGLSAAFQWLAGRHARSTGVVVDIDLQEVDRLPSEIEVACFLIAQEALANSARHARATQVELRLRMTDRDIAIEVRDNGAGFDTERAWNAARAGSSLGLLAMRERAALAGGILEIESAPGSGTTMRATLPRERG
jgi:signal transduction histidine kinase